MGSESLGLGYRVSEGAAMSYPILGKGVSKRLGPAVNIITRFNTFRPSAYYPLRDELGRGRWYYSKELLSIGYRHTGKNIVWGQTISRREGLQLLFDDLLELESNLNRELPWFHQWHYLVRAAVISRAFHEGSYFFSSKMGIAMGGGPWGTLNGSYRPSLCLEECHSSQWEHLNDKQKELRIAELDLVYLKDELMGLKEKEKPHEGHSGDTRRLQP
jgi:GH24 family phage-related lysozyme (muramidase)